MLGNKGIILAIACLTQLYVISAITTVEHKKLEFPDKELIFGDDSQEGGKLTYASCTTDTATKERQCKVVREKSAYSDDTYTCEVKIKLKHALAKNRNNDRLSIIPFAENKAIIHIVDNIKYGFMHFHTVNFDNCEVKTNEMAFLDPTDPEIHMTIVPYKDSFDLFVLIEELEKHYILKFDANGTKQDMPLGPTAPKAYSSKVTRMDSISGGARDKGTLYMEHIEGNEYEFKIRKPDGSDVSLGKREVHKPMALSTNDDLIGACFKGQDSGPKFNCTQHDLSGGEKFNMNLLKEDNKTAVVGVHNLPGGGMLIALGSCEEIICSFYQVNFSVMKVNATGAIVGTAQVGKAKAISESNNVRMSLSFHKNKDQNDCLSIANFESTETSRGDICATDYCFTDADFKK